MKFPGPKLIPVRGEPQRSPRDRRRCVRRRVQSAAFMGMNANSTGAALDLCEIRDIHEEGISFQSPAPMEPGESFSLCLDLTEPAIYIHTSGRVVWSDPSGRTGLRFHRMPSPDLQRLREWLSMGSVDDPGGEAPSVTVLPVAQPEAESAATISTSTLAAGPAEAPVQDEPVPLEFVLPAELAGVPLQSVPLQSVPLELDPADADVVEAPTPEVSAAITPEAAEEQEIAVQALPAETPPAQAPVPEPPAPAPREVEEDASALAATADVAREIEAFSLDLDAALQIVAERTKTLTGATGAAIALSTGEGMVCRASAGDDAPPLGARLQVGSGFSGECVHSGKLLSCEDSETDTLVDRESCRALGVRAIMAAPIRSPHSVIGLLEIFSPRPQAFTGRDKVILQEMTQVIFAAVQRTVQRLVVNHADEPGAAERDSNGSASGVSDLSAQAAEVEDSSGGDIFSGDGMSMRSRLWRKPKLPVIGGTVLVLLLLAAFAFVKPGSRTTAAAMQPQTTALGQTSRLQAQTASTDDLRKLAQAGDADAQFQLGLRYAVGTDVPQDYTEAAHWFSAAAEQGHVIAQSNMGAYYWAGRGVEKDLNKAYFWALLAQAGGDEASRVRVPFLASRLSQAEILNDQRQAEDWFKAHRAHSKPSPAK